MRKLFLIRKKLKERIFLDNKGFGITESILSMLLLSIITTSAIYFVSLRQQNLYKANLNKAIDDEVRRDIEKLKTELWHELYHERKGQGYGEYETNDIKYSQYCTDILNIFSRLPSARQVKWNPGSNINTYKGQKRNKIFSGNTVMIERRVVARTPFNMGNAFDRSLAEITYHVTVNNQKKQWTSIQLSSDAHSWCLPSAS